ncbi:MAG: hypothetical protein GY805_12545 [Chloroflexi bacterium]|nr:hypothetical protein [Chloroflexota bacterium]
MPSKALQPAAQKTVLFYDDELMAVRLLDGDVYVAIVQMCNSLGIDAQAQRRRMERHNILAEGVGVANLATPGGQQDTYVLRVDLIPLWLSGVRVSAVKEEIRSKLTRFQREAARVLWQAFQDGHLSTDTDFDSLLQQADSDVAQAYRMALAIVQLARQQVIMDGRIQDAEMQLTSHAQRLDQIEAALTDDSRIITEVQASHLSQAVKAVAMAMTKPNFQQVYGQMYRHYEITSYKLLPATKFDDAMQFLTAWFVRLTGNDDVPF